MRLTKGHLLFMQSDYQGALSAYMSAKTMEPSVAETYVFIGHTLGKLNQHDDAMVTLTAVSALVENKDDAIQAKALFASAAIEETRGPSEAVKEGWMAYKNYAQTHNNVVTFESTATARLAALEKMQELDKKYQLVRERIAKNNQ
jgi:cytochrome c-type biogenesis protein CcmH/NrfG